MHLVPQFRFHEFGVAMRTVSCLSSWTECRVVLFVILSTSPIKLMFMWYPGFMKVAPEIHLSVEERNTLRELTHKGEASARKIKRALILLRLDALRDGRAGRRSNSNMTVGAEYGVCARTVSRLRQRFVQAGLESALAEETRSGRPVEITGEMEAKLVMLACSAPPEGRDHWTLQLLADQMVALEYAPHLSDTEVYNRLKKNDLHPWQVKSWVIPKPDARFLAKMEDVLAVYQRPLDPRRPLVCLDEKGKELRASVQGRDPLLPQPHPGQGQIRQDYEYEHAGSLNLFLLTAPLLGWRRVAVTADRTALTFAEQVRQLVEEDFPEAEKLVLVTDNLNTHGPWALYQAFPPEQAFRIAQKLEWHYTPEHGSWLNMAELELSVLARQCLRRRFSDEGMLRRECAAWTQERNDRAVTIRWQFTAEDARIRLRRLYPVFEDKT